MAHLDFMTKQIEANLVTISELVGLDYLPEILSHENGHRYIPGDLKTFMRLTDAAVEVLKDRSLADLARNLFDDFEDNLGVFRRGMRTIAAVYHVLWHTSPHSDPVISVIGRAYELFFESLAPAQRVQGYIIPIERVTSEIEKAAREIVAIFQNLQRLYWTTAIKRFAKILEPFLKKSQQVNPQDQPGATPLSLSKVDIRNFIPGKKVDAKDLEGRLIGITRDLGRDEGEVPCTFKRFQGFLAGNGVGLKPSKALAWYYRDSIGNQTVKIPEVNVKAGTAVPYTLAPWRVSDDPDLLDLWASMMNGVLIPGLTAKRWVYKKGEHVSVGRDWPDLVIVIDSSNSMEDPEDTYSHAVASAMIISHSFLETQKQVYAVNFSGNGQFTSTANFTVTEDEVDDTLTVYYNGGTHLPYPAMQKPFRLSARPKYFVMITDLEIGNLDPKEFQKIFSASCGGTIFLIDRGQDVAATVAILESCGFNVIPVKDIADLEGHALQLTHRLFEER